EARWREQLQHQHARLRHAGAVLRAHHPQRRVAQLRERLLRLQARPQAAIARILQRDALKLRALARSLEACSPLATVARGYSIVTRGDDGALVHSVAQVAPGDRVQARLRDGTVALTVGSVTPDPPSRPCAGASARRLSPGRHPAVIAPASTAGRLEAQPETAHALRPRHRNLATRGQRGRTDRAVTGLWPARARPCGRGRPSAPARCWPGR